MTKIKRYKSGKRVYTKWGGATEEVKVFPKKKGVPGPPPKFPEITIDEQIAQGKTSNMFSIGMREGEFVLDFFWNDGKKARHISRVICPPKTIKQLLKNGS